MQKQSDSSRPTELEQLALTGVVADIVFRNESNGFCVLTLQDADQTTVVGTFPFLSPGENVRFWGSWQEHPSYGHQFSAQSYELIAPKTSQAIELYLAGGLIKGVGKVLARRLVREFGQNTLQVLLNEPAKAAAVKGISLEKAQDISEQLREKQDFQELVLLLAPLGIGMGRILRIYRHFAGDSVKVLSQNPYRLADEVFGIGFMTADRLATQLGLAADSPARLAGALRYCLLQAATSGHTYLPQDLLLEQAAVLLQQELKDPLTVLADMGREKQLILDEKTDEKACRVALPALYYTEFWAAQRLLLLLAEKADQGHFDFAETKARTSIVQAAHKLNLALAAEQENALLLALTQPFMILTGGPGTGKTTILQLLCDLLEGQGKKILLAAPTGRAAKRLGEATARPAKTLHRLLQLQVVPDLPDQAFVPQEEEQEQLEADLVIVDEASMIDIYLLRNLVDALKRGTRLVLVGDADQLPSVGPGDVLRNLIESGKVPTARLSRIFRQSAQSLIIRNAHLIHDGIWPELDQKKDSQFLFIPKDNAISIAEAVVRLCQVILPQEYGLDPLRDVFVLTPTRKGPAGTVALNQALQEELLPPEMERSGLNSHGRFFGLGDKVMQMRNNYELAWQGAENERQKGKGVFNGETGTIIAVDEADSTLHVLFDDDRIAFYDRVSLDDLELAYAITVHKSQGSEYPVVVLAVAPGAPQLLSRNLLYTAATRARQKLLLVSSRRVISQMLANVQALSRYTQLKDWLIQTDDN